MCLLSSRYVFTDVLPSIYTHGHTPHKHTHKPITIEIKQSKYKKISEKKMEIKFLNFDTYW